MKPKPIVSGLAFASLFFAILLPPEAYSDGKMAVLLCATFAFFIRVSERQIGRSYLLAGLAAFGILVLHSVFLSADSYRSIEFVATLWSYYCLAGFFLYAGFDPVKPLAFSMVALSVIVSGYGLYQYFWGFEELTRFIMHSGSNEIVKAPALGIIATRRVFSTLALPGTLWGFLVMAIPFHAVLWKKNTLVKVLLVVSILMLLATGFLTRSFGFLVGLLVMTLAWTVLHHRRMLWNRMTFALLPLGILAAAFYSARRGVIAGSNPVILRFANWISAWSIFSMNPLGTGLNTFGVIYPRYMLPGANETQFTHNTALQLLSELGWFAIVAAVIGILLIAKKWPQISKFQFGERECVFIALVVWGIHNMVDIDVYFASVGSVGAVLIGVLLRKPEGLAPEDAPGRGLIAASGFVALAAVVFSGLVLFSTELQNRAQGEYDNLKPEAAVATLMEARAFMPFDSSLYHDAGQIQLELAQKKHDPKLLGDAAASFRRAIELSPNKVGPHVGLGLCLSSTHDYVDAMKEIRVAQRLYPDSTNTQAIGRLIEQHLQ